MSEKKEIYTGDDLITMSAIAFGLGALIGYSAHSSQVAEHLKETTIREVFVTVTRTEYHADPPVGSAPVGFTYYKFWTDEFDTKGLECKNEFQTQSTSKHPVPEEGQTYKATLYRNSLSSNSCKIELIEPL